MPTAASPYLVGPGDILGISVLEQKDLDQHVTVRPDGTISLPIVGDVDAAGLTVSEVATRLTTLYGRTLHGAHVVVAVKEIRSRPVFIMGGVRRPGAVQLSEELTILEVLSRAGGPVSNADLESAFVLRGTARIPVDLRRLLNDDTVQNLSLRVGDTIVVPTVGLNLGASGVPNVAYVRVEGEVTAPGWVKHTNDLTIRAAIDAAGGLTPYASGLVTVARWGLVPVMTSRQVPPRLDGRPEELGLSIMPQHSSSAVRSDAQEDHVDRVKLSGPLGDRLHISSLVRLRPGDTVIVHMRLYYSSTTLQVRLGSTPL